MEIPSGDDDDGYYDAFLDDDFDVVVHALPRYPPQMKMDRSSFIHRLTKHFRTERIVFGDN